MSHVSCVPSLILLSLILIRVIRVNPRLILKTQLQSELKLSCGEGECWLAETRQRSYALDKITTLSSMIL